MPPKRKKGNDWTEPKRDAIKKPAQKMEPVLKKAVAKKHVVVVEEEKEGGEGKNDSEKIDPPPETSSPKKALSKKSPPKNSPLRKPEKGKKAQRPLEHVKEVVGEWNLGPKLKKYIYSDIIKARKDQTGDKGLGGNEDDDDTDHGDDILNEKNPGRKGTSEAEEAVKEAFIQDRLPEFIDILPDSHEAHLIARKYLMLYGNFERATQVYYHEQGDDLAQRRASEASDTRYFAKVTKQSEAKAEEYLRKIQTSGKDRR
ncbi:hypothetical protein B0J14DRAFT_561923 [Halenospora varia]|nr:hypothetical protein B0J14DRAFT_561923 [Halenospora varia]